jgi:hypothetical protein
MIRLICAHSGRADEYREWFEDQWDKYRYSQWVNELRGQVLLSLEPTEKRLQRIRDYYSDLGLVCGSYCVGCDYIN